MSATYPIIGAGGAELDPVALAALEDHVEELRADNPHGLDDQLDAVDTALAARQPLDSDLTAIAALSTTAFGRSLLASADAAAVRTAISAAAASHSHAITDVAGLQAAIDGKQPLDSDLTALAALTTASFGRSLLEAADAAAVRSAISAAAASHNHDGTYQPIDSDLTAVAALSTTSFGRGLLESADAAAVRTAISAAAASHSHVVSDVTGLQAALDAKQATSQKGQANGYAELDGSGRVPTAQMPVSAMEYKGAWNATTNSPALADGTGSAGDLYRVSTAGTQNLGSGSIDFVVGDYVIYNGATWEKGDTTDAVSSVAGRTGAVTLVKGDVGLGNVDNTADSAKPVSSAQQSALDAKQDAATAATDAELAAHAADTTSVHGIADTTALIESGDAAGGVLAGTYPDPSFAADMATQAELDAGLALKQDASTAVTDAELAAHEADTTSIHGIANTAALVVDGDSAGGDLAGTYPDPAVNKIRGKNVPAPGAPEDEKGFRYDHDTGAFIWTDFATQAELDDHADNYGLGAHIPTDGITDTHVKAAAAIAQSKIANLTGDLAAKQDASSAATDAELAAHEADTTSVHGISDTSALVVDGDAAGGVLSGTYPNPGFASDMATQAELDAVAAAKQNLDAELTALAGLTSAADKGVHFTGSGTAATHDLTSAGRALLDDANAAAQRVTLDVPSNAEAVLDILVDAKGDLIVGTAADAVARKAAGANGKTLVADSSQSDGLLYEDSPAIAYKSLRPFQWGLIPGSTVAGTYCFWTQGVVVLAAATSSVGAFYLDPAEFAVGGRTTKLRLRGGLATNAVDPGTLSFTVHLYPVATWAGASGLYPTIATVGASLASQLVITDPAASSQYIAAGSDFDCPAAGWYVLAMVTTATTAANSHLDMYAGLQVRQVW